MTTITLRSGRTLDAGGDIIGLALDTDPPTVWHGYDGRISLQLDTDHDPEFDRHALTAEETADLATQMAAAWLRLRDRALPEAAKLAQVAAAPRIAPTEAQIAVALEAWFTTQDTSGRFLSFEGRMRAALGAVMATEASNG